MPRTASGLHRKRSRRVGYQIRLDLLGAKPPIWRRLDLPSDLMLDDVHEAIQAAMGWTGGHLHAFSLGTGWDAIRFAAADPFGGTFDDGFSDDDGPDETQVRLDQVLHEVGEVLDYEYDFGDSWEHRLKLEKILDRAPDDAAVRFVTGKRACPPEDCGGIWAYSTYQETAQALADGIEVDEADLDNLRYVWPTQTGQQILDQMAELDTDHINKALANLR